MHPAAGRRVAIIGSRNFPDPALVTSFVERLPATDTVLSGGARGVDSWAAETAAARGMKIEIFPADWQTHGRRAGPLRNARIVAAADRLVAFWDRHSRGTLNSIILAAERGLPIDVVGPAGETVSETDYTQACWSLGVVEALARGRATPAREE